MTNTKITTEDCKKFLADHFRKHPQDFFEYCDADLITLSQQISIASKPSSWIRLGKVSAKSYIEYTHDVLPASVKTVRAFACDPKVFDSSAAWNVYEHADGTLSLGEYVGD